VPVLVVKGDPGAPLAWPIRRILVAISQRPDAAHARRVLGFVAPIARSVDASVTVLHVMSQLPIPPVGAPDDWEASAEQLVADETLEGRLLDRDRRILEQLGVTTHLLVRHGLVIDEVLGASADGRFDLVVIGGHEQGSWLQNLMLANVAQAILHRAVTPVLTVHD
jgi:nucleotide-binding universal stress UspA family protein